MSRFSQIILLRSGLGRSSTEVYLFRFCVPLTNLGSISKISTNYANNADFRSGSSRAIYLIAMSGRSISEEVQECANRKFTKPSVSNFLLYSGGLIIRTVINYECVPSLILKQAPLAKTTRTLMLLRFFHTFIIRSLRDHGLLPEFQQFPDFVCFFI